MALQAKRVKVHLTQNETGEFGMVIWLDTKSMPEADNRMKQVLDSLSRGQGVIEAGQMIKNPTIIKPPGML